MGILAHNNSSATIYQPTQNNGSILRNDNSKQQFKSNPTYKNKVTAQKHLPFSQTPVTA